MINAKLAQVMGLGAHTELMEAVLERDTQRSIDLLGQHVRLTSDVYLSFQKLILEHHAA